MSAPRFLLSAAALVLPLAACSSMLQIPEEVDRAVGVSCVDSSKRPPKPKVRSDGEIKALDDYKVIPALRADRSRLIEHVDSLEAIVDGCAQVAPPR
jgi:hypothetical protein